MKNLNLVIFLSIILSFFNASCPKINQNMKITEYQLQVPVLKLKENNPVLRMNIKVPENITELVVTSLNFSLKGCDDLQDIKSVRLYYLAKDSNWTDNSNKVQYGIASEPNQSLIFKDSLHLMTGENFFWVSYQLSDIANLHHKVDVSLEKVTFSDNSYAHLEKKSPPIRQRIGVAVRKHMDDEVFSYRIPGLVTTNEGTLLGIYDVRRNSSRDLQGDIDIGLSRSTDAGNSWEAMRLVLDRDEWGGLPQKFNGVSDACILLDKNTGDIFVAGLWMHGILDKNGKWIEGLTEENDAWGHQWRGKGSQPGINVKQTSQFLLTKSSDDGKTWSESINLTRKSKKKEWWLWAPAPGHGITLQDGTLLFPTQGRDEDGIPFSNIAYSTDGGRSWITSNPASSNTTENMAVQLTDGSIMLNIRDNRNRTDLSENNGRSVYITKDLGETWQEHPTSRGTLIESTCMASIHKHIYSEEGISKSILLFSNPNTKQGRHHTTIKVSFDDGNSWPEEYWYLLDEGKNRGYSCLTSIDEQTIGILYEGSQADMTFESIPLKEILNKTGFD